MLFQPLCVFFNGIFQAVNSKCRQVHLDVSFARTCFMFKMLIKTESKLASRFLEREDLPICCLSNSDVFNFCNLNFLQMKLAKLNL